MLVSAVRHLSSATRCCARRSAVAVPLDFFISLEPLRIHLAVDRRWTLRRAVQTVTEIAEPGNDELMAVQPLIHHGGVNRNVRVMLLDKRDAFRRGDDADHADVVRAG